eukprot:3152261-Rhodomonas_salina.1
MHLFATNTNSALSSWLHCLLCFFSDPPHSKKQVVESAPMSSASPRGAPSGAHSLPDPRGHQDLHALRPGHQVLRGAPAPWWHALRPHPCLEECLALGLYV